MADPNDTPAVNAAPADTNLTIQDLQTVLQIFQVVSTRGAIKAEEMGTVGPLYTKLKAFLDAAAKAAEEQKAPAAPPAIPPKDAEKLPSDDAKITGNDEK